MRTISTAVQEFNIGGLRMDASFYASPGIQAAHILAQWRKSNKQNRIDTLHDVCIPKGYFIPSRFKRVYVNDDDKHGAPYLTGGNVLQVDPLEGTRFLSRKYTSNWDELTFQERMILLTCSGSIGNAVYVNKDLLSSVGSPDLIRIIADPGKILPGYLFAVISSSFSKALIQQKTYGAVIPHIEAHHVKDLPIPRLNSAIEERIHKLIEQSAELWIQASKHLQQARKYFEFIDNEEVLSFSPHNFDLSVIKTSELNDRIGGYYHSKIYRDIEHKIRSGQHKELRDLAIKIFAPPLFKHIYLNNPNQYPFLTGGELVNRQFADIKYLSTKGVKNINDYVVKDGYVAVYRHGQYESMLGTSFLIDKRLDNFCLSDLVIRIVVDKSIISPEYVFAFLSTRAGKLLIKRLATGRSIPFVTENSLSKIPVPILGEKMIDDISELVRSALASRSTSIQLEDEAKKILSHELSSV